MKETSIFVTVVYESQFVRSPSFRNNLMSNPDLIGSQLNTAMDVRDLRTVRKFAKIKRVQFLSKNKTKTQRPLIQKYKLIFHAFLSECNFSP